MSDPRRQLPHSLLDACAVLSLYATRQMAEILTTIQGSVAVADVVVHESLFIRHVVKGEVERKTVDLIPIIEAGLLEVIHAEHESELLTFIDLAVELDDGEAMTAALAIHRDYVLVTDDRKAERVLNGRVQIRPTLELIKDWAESQRITNDVLCAALIGVDQRGYRPAAHHPLKGWWDDAMSND